MHGRITIEDWTRDDVDAEGMRMIFDLFAVDLVAGMRQAGLLVWLVPNNQVDWRGLAALLAASGRHGPAMASA